MFSGLSTRSACLPGDQYVEPEKGTQALPPSAIGVQYYNDRAIAATIPANAAVKTNIAKSASFSLIQCLFETGR